MIYSIYAIHDKHAGYGSLTLSDNDAVAMRNFQNAINIQDSIFSTSPSDFSLVRLGSYDTKNGIIDSVEPFVVARALDFIKGE